MSTRWTEDAIQFDCQGESLLGVVTHPATRRDTGVVIVVGGPQYRIGAHRQFVLLARHLAAAGYPTLRFDYRGMGDSGGAPRNFESIDADITAAISAIKTSSGVSRVVLWGLCDAASAALMYTAAHTQSKHLQGLCLLNPWVRTDASLAKTQLKHYYIQRFCEATFWRKMLHGTAVLAAIRGIASNIGMVREHSHTEQPAFIQRMQEAWCGSTLPMLAIIAGRDMAGLEFLNTRGCSDWQPSKQAGNRQWQHIADADHTFSHAPWREQMQQVTLAWLDAICQPCTAGEMNETALQKQGLHSSL